MKPTPTPSRRRKLPTVKSCQWTSDELLDAANKLGSLRAGSLYNVVIVRPWLPLMFAALIPIKLVESGACISDREVYVHVWLRTADGEFLKGMMLPPYEGTMGSAYLEY